MNTGTAILLLFLIVGAALAIRHVLRTKRFGGCSGCPGGCAGCQTDCGGHAKAE